MFDVLDIAIIILSVYAIIVHIAFKNHNENLMQYKKDWQKKYYQYVKENWMFLNNNFDNVDYETELKLIAENTINDDDDE